MAKQSKSVEESVEDVAIGVPAVLCNWFVMSRYPFAFRLALGERATANGKLLIRGAFVIAPSDLLALRNLLDAALANPATPVLRPH